MAKDVHSHRGAGKAPATAGRKSTARRGTAPTGPSVEEENKASRAAVVETMARQGRILYSSASRRGRNKAGKTASFDSVAGDLEQQRRPRLEKKQYEAELARLQVELVKLQEWVKANGLKIVMLFEGRDAAGKGGAIKRITEALNPRVCRTVALGVPTDRERSQWYFQRYVPTCRRRARSWPSTAAGTTGPA